MHMWCPQVWAQQQSLLLVVSGAQHSRKDSICLDLCLNLNPDCLASPSSPLPPFLSPTRPSSLFVVQGHSLGSLSFQAEQELGYYIPSTAARFCPVSAEVFPQIRGKGVGKQDCPEDTSLSHDMENRAAETNSEVDKSASPSVAQLAGKFKEQAANITGKEVRSSSATKQVPPHKPTRRKPPCSLPLYSHKSETSDNDEQKRSPNACPIPKVKVKSSPMIEKLQVRTRGSIKRRPPSRRFRRSLSDYGDGEDLGVNITSPENGAKEDGDEVFGPKGKTEEAETGSKEQKKQTGSDEKPPSRKGSSRSEDEEKGEKQAEEMTPCKTNTGDTKEEDVCRGAPGGENSPQPPSGDKEEKVCEGPQGEEQQGTASEQEKGDKEKEEVKTEAEAEVKETSESTDAQRTSDTEETPLAPEPLQDTVGLETASEASTSATQDQGTA
ncbi:capZ-interacting protein isoform 4-T5 [Alca torda]